MSPKIKTYFLILFIYLTFINLAVSNSIWQKDSFRISLENNQLELFHNQQKILQIQSLQFNFIEPDTILIDKTETDKLILKLIFNQTDGFHEDFPSDILLTISQHNNSFHFHADHPAFNHITIKLKDLDEHYFGLIEKCYPGNLKSPDLRGNVIDVEVYGNGNRDYTENYASVYSAFYMSSLGYGSFFDTFAKGRYHLAVNGTTEIYHQTNSLDWYIFYGPTGDKIHREYFNLIGRPKYVPIWACGPIFWRDQNNGGKDEILDDIDKFTELKIPLTACWVDRPYSRGGHEWSKMNFNKKFSKPEKWIKTINEKYGLQFMTWVGSLTFTDKDFPGLLPVYPRYIDLSDPDALKEFERRLNTFQYAVGVRGHKMDRADEHFPVTVGWHEPVTESESRNKYVFLYAKTIHNFLLKAYGKDQFNFARSAFHRCQPFLSGVWGGDNRSNWQGMAGSQANAIRCGFMGFPVWGQDTGGYLGPGRIDKTLYTRWLQWGVWNGMFEVKIDGSGGSGEDRPPWKYSQQLQKVFRKICEWRMQLLPSIYSWSNTSYRNGVLMKPLVYVYPDDKKTYDIWDEYIFGNAFLVAPFFTKESIRDIYLPEGKWLELDDPNKEYIGPTTITKNCPLEFIPVFIKANSIYITGDVYRGNSKVWKGDLNSDEEITIHLFPGSTHDRTTFMYVDYFDQDKEKSMVLEHQPGQIIFQSEPVMTRSCIELKCTAKPDQVMLNEESIEYHFNQKNKMIKVSIGKNNAINLKIYYPLQEHP